MTAGSGAGKIVPLFCLALAAATLAALHAGFAARDLDSDGAYYLLSARSGLYLLEPARITVQFLQQSLAFAAAQFGVQDLYLRGQLLTLGMQGWPVLLTGLCWFALPRGEKNWVLGPLLNLALVIPATSFIGIGEGSIASCLMWLLFFLVEFESPSPLRFLAALALTGACVTLHEAAFPFMLGIAILAGLQARDKRGLPRLGRTLLALLALAAALHLFYVTAHPRDPVNRGMFLASLFSDAWVTVTPQASGLNLPAFAGLAAGICLLLAQHPVAQKRVGRAALALAVMVAALFIAVPQWVAIPQNFFAARGLPIVATMLLTAAIHFLRRAGWRADAMTPPPVVTVLLAMIAMNLVVQTALTLQWSRYRDDLSALVVTHAGIVPWAEANAMLNPGDTYFRQGLARVWNSQPLSIVLAPQGQVRAMVDARPGIAWKPYNLAEPATLPRCTTGLDWSHFGLTPCH